jgi:hypothetical protein
VPTDSRRPNEASRPGGRALLARELCRVIGLNQNFTTRSGTGYHLQIEDRGPVYDDALEEAVRRVNTIVYANYGEPTARIVYGRDTDFMDLRTQEHNRHVETEIQRLAAEAKEVLEEREERQAARIKALVRHYHWTRDESVKRELDESKGLFPFVFNRAWQELKAEMAPAAEEAPATSAPEPEIDETIYPLDRAQRDLVLEIERIREELERDLADLKGRGAADDILLAACAKILYRAHESLTQRAEHGTDFTSRRLEMTKNSLVTTYRQVRARLTRLGETKA